MIRIPVTSADFDSGRIKSSISKLSKHHPDQSVKPKRSFAQQTFAQILGYGGYEELRSQAKHNGPAYSGQSLAIEQFIAPISLRISRYWGVSSDKAEHVAAALGLIHLDAFRATARTIQQPLMRENRVSPPGHLPNLGISPGPILDAIRRATVMPLAQLEAFQDAMKSMVHIAAIQDAMKPSAAIAAIQDAMKPSAAIAAIQDAMKPSAAIAAIQDAMKPSAAMAAIQDAMKPSAAMAAIQDAMKPSAAIAAIQDAMKPSAAMAAIQDALKPMAHIAALQDVLRPSAKMAAIQDALKPLARITSDLDRERIHNDV
ncbi:hypothetical protein [Pseudomonas chlororaphis]|uniref:hypothetical protein n=1 Tax=Pseudomonas chlororaphis TaxID=587753 RepID=UPI000B199657|nr:hypothetical protein [Pseudomonas chlororaphis]